MKKKTGPKRVSNRLDEIGAAIAGGAPASRFKLELDALLGTEMEERDHDIEAAWEADYRNGPFSGE